MAGGTAGLVRRFRGGGLRSPAEDGVEAGAAWVDLEGVGEGDHDYDCKTPDCGGGAGGVLGDDVADDVGAV